MNLATRCTACGTLFRVVQDQLKVSEGWVRCGRCETVFNAQENLFDLEHDTPPPWPAPHAADLALATEPVDNDSALAPSLAPDGACEPRVSEEAGVAPAARAAVEPAWPAATSDGEPEPLQVDVDAATAVDATLLVEEGRTATEEPTTEPVFVASDDAAVMSPQSAAPSPTALEDAPSDITPAFVQQARRRERWQQPSVRRMLWAAVAASTLLLGAQIIHHSRQTIAAQHPGAMPWLEGFCGVAGCRIDALQRIDDVNIETTALTQVPRVAPASSPASSIAPSSAPDDAASVPVDAAASAPDSEANVLRLSITLRNRGERAIAMPSVDLSLTGSDGDLVARRSLSPRDFGIQDARLPPGLDTPLSLRFRVAGGRVSGYTVEVFYP